MGKSKNKKLKQTPETVQPSSPGDLDTALPSYVKAIDGHNTQGWTDGEIKAYNELIVERQKLEKQRHELEEKCAKSQTQRALLHENVANIDSLFQQQKSMTPSFKFTGSGYCCVEIDATTKCHHEICKRAKKEGVSDIELDTIKYYAMRVHTEKSERIRNALRKQRDLELIRVKKEEDEGVAQSTRKSSKKPKATYGDGNKSSNRGSRGKDISKAAKETEKIVNKIINQLDDLRSDLQTGRISAEEAQGKLNILDSKLPAMQDKASHGSSSDGVPTTVSSRDMKSTTESFQSHLRERLLNAKGDTFSQAFSIMDHFLSATKPDELQEAIAELKDVLQLSGPMCDELQSSLGALEGIFDNPDKLSFTGPDGKQECSSIIDLMEKLKDTLKRTGQLPDGANASLTKVFQECIDLEAEAKVQLTHKCTDESVSSAELPAALAKIKEENVAKSPIPPLTSNKLDSDIANLLDVYDAKQLLAKTRSGVDPTALEAQITSLVILRTQKKSTKYIEKLERLDIACRSAGGQDGSNMLREAIANVLDKMKKFVPASDIKKGKQPAISAPPQTSASGEAIKTSTQTVVAINTSKSKATARTDISAATAETPSREAYKSIRAAIEEHGKYGLMDTFQIYAGRTSFEPDLGIVEKAQSYAEKTHIMIEDQAFGIQATVSYLYKLKICPGIAAVLVSQALFDIADSSEDDFRRHIKEFSSCIAGLALNIANEWSTTFQHISLAMTQLYVATYVELMATFPKMSALFPAMSVTDMFMKYTLLSRSSQASLRNMSVLTDYLLICFGTDTVRNIPSLSEALKHYQLFCCTEKYRCLTVSPCSKHMNFARMPFTPRAGQWQSLRKQHDGRRYSSPPATKTANPVPVQTNPTITKEPEILMKRGKIRPMKSIVVYPPGHQAKQESEPVPAKKDLRYEEALKRAAVLYVAEARRAHAIQTFQTDGISTKNSFSPAELLAAIADVSSMTEADLDIPFDDRQVAEPDVTLVSSRFSEHLDEPQRSGRTTMARVLNVQNIFKQIRSGERGPQYLDSLVDSIKKRALSGQYPNPVEAITKYANALVKVGKIPVPLEQGLVKVQDNLQSTLEDADQRFVFETRRLRYFLGTVEAEEPSLSALYRLASRASPAFREYCEIISDKLEETETSTVEMLEQAWSDITQLVKTVKLREDSPSLIDFARHAMEDWSQRPRDITNYVSDNEDNTFLSSDEEEMNELVVQGLATLKDEPSLITRSPARQPIFERQSSVASAVASRASLSSPDQLHHAQKMDLSVENSNALPDATQSDVASTSSAAILQATENNDGASEPDEHLTEEGAAHMKVIQEQDDSSLHSASNGAAVLPTNESNLQKTDHQQTQNPLSGDEELTDMEDNPAATPKPPSENMLDMMKYLKKLQGNARDAFETAEVFGRFNEEHGKVMRGVAEKLAKQVADYTEFVGQIGGWNGTEIPKELLEWKAIDAEEGSSSNQQQDKK